MLKVIVSSQRTTATRMRLRSHRNDGQARCWYTIKPLDVMRLCNAVRTQLPLPAKHSSVSEAANLAVRDCCAHFSAAPSAPINQTNVR